jgi:uncharacterized protein YbjT (DUF2867 family)
MRERVLFIAGSTGAVGRTVVHLAEASGIQFVSHVRPRRAAAGPLPPRAAVFELSDEERLLGTLRGCTTVLQLIGTMRRRFAQGDTYETSDVGTTAALARAAARAGIDHFVLLSSVGAGRPVGAYLAAKARAEALVRDSGIPFTILRPSAFVGEGHRVPPGMALLTRLPGLRALEPIRVDDVARALLRAGTERAPLDEVLEGRAVRALAR